MPAALHTSRLTRFAWLSIAAAVATMGLKTSAWLLTGSVGFLSDAAESVVNLVAAVVALLVLRLAAQPPDEEHEYGHEKAEYFAAGVEGALIVLAAGSIAWAALDRLRDPQELTSVGIGVAVSVVAAAINLAVAVVLVREGRRYRSITLEADGRHLLTDVWTSVGVVVGVTAVSITGWEPLDPIVALVVAVNVVAAGAVLLRRSTGGLMDRALPAADRAAIDGVLDRHRGLGVQFHAVRTRGAGLLSPYYGGGTPLENRADHLTLDEMVASDGRTELEVEAKLRAKAIAEQPDSAAAVTSVAVAPAPAVTAEPEPA